MESAWRTRVLVKEDDLAAARDVLNVSSEPESTDPKLIERPEKKFWRIQLVMWLLFLVIAILVFGVFRLR